MAVSRAYIHTSCGRLAPELEELGLQPAQLLLQRLHCPPMLLLQLQHLVSEAATQGLVLGRELTHGLCVLRLHRGVLRLHGAQPGERAVLCESFHPRHRLALRRGPHVHLGN